MVHLANTFDQCATEIQLYSLLLISTLISLSTMILLFLVDQYKKEGSKDDYPEAAKNWRTSQQHSSSNTQYLDN